MTVKIDGLCSGNGRFADSEKWTLACTVAFSKFWRRVQFWVGEFFVSLKCRGQTGRRDECVLGLRLEQDCAWAWNGGVHLSPGTVSSYQTGATWFQFALYSKTALWYLVDELWIPLHVKPWHLRNRRTISKPFSALLALTVQLLLLLCDTGETHC